MSFPRGGGGGGAVFLCPSQFIHETSHPIRENSCRVPVDTNIIKNNMILKYSKVIKQGYLIGAFPWDKHFTEVTFKKGNCGRMITYQHFTH